MVMRYTSALFFAVLIASVTDATAQSRRSYPEPSREDCPQGRQIRTQKNYPATMSDCEVLDADTIAENQKLHRIPSSISDPSKPPSQISQQPPVVGHPLGWVACEYKWQDAGRPADYKAFMNNCIASSPATQRETVANPPPPLSPTKVRTPKEAADETADKLRNCVTSTVNQSGEAPSVQTARDKCHVELDGFMQACRNFWLSIGHTADACDLNAMGVISSVVRSDTGQSTQQASESDDLMYCVNPEIQYGQYSSYDGGKSVMTILEGKCKRQYLKFLQSCEQSEDSRTCVLGAATATQLAIKKFGK